ncbi:Uncharacterized protein TSPI_04378 [Trichinella spiralis]|uniref:Uncharacterized protein n=1 Tax=Trichinella spiralis TaxID=6334 RepID=A0ABR3K338_TRISP
MRKVWLSIRAVWPGYQKRPLASDVLRVHLITRQHPAVTSFFIPYRYIQDEHFGQSCFNFEVDKINYRIMRTGCFPFVKYYCNREAPIDNYLTDKFFTILKILNLGIPCLLYGVIAWFLVQSVTTYYINGSKVILYFLLPEED